MKKLIIALTVALSLVSPMASADENEILRELCGVSVEVASVAYDVAKSGVSYRDFVTKTDLPTDLYHDVGMAYDAVRMNTTKERLRDDVFRFCLETNY